MSTRLLINASHTKLGGGLTYLQGILPYFVEQDGLDLHIDLHLLAPQETLANLALPPQVKKAYDAHLPFWLLHAWEQLILPIKARFWGITHTLCNANYVPLLCPRPTPILHNNPLLARYEKRWCYRCIGGVYGG